MNYYKGYAKNGRRSITKVYDTLQPGFHDDYMVEVVDVSDGSRKFFRSTNDLTDYKFTREITENEYNLYCSASRMLTEIWMNQFTGGFPRNKDVLSLEKDTRRNLSAVLNELKRQRNGDPLPN